jgi:hypothetical protein
VRDAYLEHNVGGDLVLYGLSAAASSSPGSKLSASNRSSKTRSQSGSRRRANPQIASSQASLPDEEMLLNFSRPGFRFAEFGV